jgi:hypothetical protein
VLFIDEFLIFASNKNKEFSMPKTRHVFVWFVLLAIMMLGCTSQEQPQEQAEKIGLFNGHDFTGWIKFIPDDTTDVDKVWMVEEGVIHCVGTPTGYIRTVDSYSDYKLHVEWRWVETPGNSGVLLHCQEPDQVWPNCLEAQLKTENAGDFVIIGPGQITVDGQEFTNTERFLSVPKKHDNIEKPAGEWNTYDITCKGATVSVTVNGTLQNEATDVFVTSGPIALQSEGAPIQFRNIFLEKL